MADSILRLRVESQEYDNKLKRAAEGIRHLADVAHKSAGDMTGLEQSTLDYIKSIGEMETKSRSAAGQVRELESTYKELKVIYDQLNDVEKADEGGKALAASLEQLKQRAQDARTSLDNASKSLQENDSAAKEDSSALEALASKFTLNIDALKLFDVGLTAAKAALDVAKDAFFASEANVDEWGRTVDASKSLYEGFLTALNTGDISGYLNNINQIVTAARAAYDELDRLGTMKTIQAPQVSAQQTENERIRSMIQTGRYIAPVDGRRNAVFNGREMQNGDKLTAGQIRALEKQLQNGMQNVVKLVGNEVKQTGKAINAYYDSIAKQNGMSLQEFKKGTSTWEEFEKKIKGYEEYRKWDTQARTEFAKQGGRGNVDFDKNNPFAEFKKWGTFRVDKMGENSYNDLVRLIQQRDQQAAQAYGMQSQAYRTINRAEGFTVSKLMGNGGTGNKNKKDLDELQKVQKQIADLTKEAYTADESRQAEIQKQIAGLQQQEQKLTKIRDIITGKSDGLNLDKLFPDHSEQNYNTGYVGSKQARQDGMNADYGMALEKLGNAPINTQSLQTFISEAKSLLQQADLGSDLYTSLTERLQDATAMSTLLQDFAKAGVDGADLASIATDLKERLMNGDIPDDVIQGYVDQLNEKLKEKFDETEWPEVLVKFNPDTNSINRMTNDMEEDASKTANAWNMASRAISGIGSALNQIEDPSEKILATVLQGIANVVQGAGTATSKAAGQSRHWTEYLAAAAAITAQMITTVSQIHSITGYASGGVVKGNSFSGDNVGPVMLDAGELILNRSQQNVLAEQLTVSEHQDGPTEPYVTGEMLYLGLNNYLKRSGKGEIVTSKRG